MEFRTLPGLLGKPMSRACLVVTSIEDTPESFAMLDEAWAVGVNTFVAEFGSAEAPQQAQGEPIFTRWLASRGVERDEYALVTVGALSSGGEEESASLRALLSQVGVQHADVHLVPRPDASASLQSVVSTWSAAVATGLCNTWGFGLDWDLGPASQAANVLSLALSKCCAAPTCAAIAWASPALVGLDGATSLRKKMSWLERQELAALYFHTRETPAPVVAPCASAPLGKRRRNATRCEAGVQHAPDHKRARGAGSGASGARQTVVIPRRQTAISIVGSLPGAGFVAVRATSTTHMLADVDALGEHARDELDRFMRTPPTITDIGSGSDTDTTACSHASSSSDESSACPGSDSE